MKAESTQKGKSRWYSCPKCGDQHPSVTTILDVISSPALMGWMAKNGTAKLKVMHEIVNEIVPQVASIISEMAETRWKLTENTAFFKSGKETGAEAADYGTIVSKKDKKDLAVYKKIIAITKKK